MELNVLLKKSGIMILLISKETFQQLFLFNVMNIQVLIILAGKELILDGYQLYQLLQAGIIAVVKV
jgi:hypothetical protein